MGWKVFLLWEGKNLVDDVFLLCVCVDDDIVLVRMELRRDWFGGSVGVDFIILEMRVVRL